MTNLRLGRLSVDGETDAANQIAEVLAYQDSPSLLSSYDRAALWAHKENAPGKYVGAHEIVRTASYAVAPTFSTHYGHQAGVTGARGCRARERCGSSRSEPFSAH